MFHRCVALVVRAKDFNSFYHLALKKFKQSCADLGFLHDKKASLEDCIVGIQQALLQANGKDLQVGLLTAFSTGSS